MASNISTENLNENYPVAGVDNDSQGFRDNFNVIKTNLNQAKIEIDDLQTGAVRVDQDNNFNDSKIINAVMQDTQELANKGFSSLSQNQDISYVDGQVYEIGATADVVLSLADFPASNYGRMRLVLFGDGTPRQITIQSKNGNAKTDGNIAFQGTNVVQVQSSTSPKIIDAFTTDGGAVIYLSYIGEFS